MDSTEDNRRVVSMSGSPIYRHTEATPFAAPQGEECIEQISAHIETHLGPVAMVFHEIVSDTVHIDVHHVKPTHDFPFVRLVTSGMSDLPMCVPQDADVPRYAEVMITLPGDWRLDQESFNDECWYWPVRLLKGLARLPHKYRTWLGFGHTVPQGDPPEPYAENTRFCGSIVLPPVSVPGAFQTLRIDDHKEITFWAVVPLYREEMNFKLRSGCDALLDKFAAAGIADIVDLQRKNVAKKILGIF